MEGLRCLIVDRQLKRGKGGSVGGRNDIDIEGYGARCVFRYVTACLFRCVVINWIEVVGKVFVVRKEKVRITE